MASLLTYVAAEATSSIFGGQLPGYLLFRIVHTYTDLVLDVFLDNVFFLNKRSRFDVLVVISL